MTAEREISFLSGAPVQRVLRLMRRYREMRVGEREREDGVTEPIGKAGCWRVST